MARGREDWERLGRVARKERAYLEVTQAAVAKAARFSVETLRKIEQGTWRSGDPWETLRKLDRGLRWQEGSAERVFTGDGDPVRLEAAEPVDLDLVRLQYAWAGLPAAVRRCLADVAERYRP